MVQWLLVKPISTAPKTIVEFFCSLVFADAFIKIFQMLFGVALLTIIQMIFGCSRLLTLRIQMRIAESLLGSIDFLEQFGSRRPMKKPLGDFCNSNLFCIRFY